MIDDDLQKTFLTDTDSSGRFVVKSFRTGKTYYIEPLDDGNNTKWGDLNPSTKKLEGDYGTKYKGSVKRTESLITEENGFDNIVELEPGESPIDYINRLDDEYYRQGYRNCN